MIIAKLSSAFPDDEFVGEESGGVDADHLWIIDPIDGTANFARGMPYWSVVVAYAVEGVLEIGVTYDPVSDEVFAARRGQGAWLNGKPISVAQRGGVEQSVIGTTFLRSQTGSAEYTKIVGRILDAGGDHRRMGSTALMLAHVADGRLDACVVPSCNTWDVASGLLLVREAGGVVNDFIAENGVIGSGPVGAGSAALGPFIEDLVDVKVS
jgi:myo-inositol-1(or 4)-monophosphatase